MLIMQITMLKFITEIYNVTVSVPLLWFTLLPLAVHHFSQCLNKSSKLFSIAVIILNCIIQSHC